MALSLCASRRAALCFAVSAALALGAPREAHADEVERPYTGQVLVVDAVTLGLLGVSYLSYDSAREASALTGTVSLLAYMFTTPVLHVAHGQYFASVLSLALRIALPVAALAASKDDPNGIVLIAALAAPTVLDAAVLARPHDPYAGLKTPPPKANLRVSPYVGASGAGVAGSF